MSYPPPRRGVAPPPFKVGDKVFFRRHPDGVETVTAVYPCPTGRHHISMRRQLGELVEATRYARSGQFQFARIPTDRSWRRRAAAPLKLATLGACAAGAWLFVAATALAGLWLFRHV